MASPVVVYFAGIGTIVAALGLGFGGGLMLMSSTPVQKEPAAAYAKREQPPVVEPQAPAATPAPTVAANVAAETSPAMPPAQPPAPRVATNAWVETPPALPVPKTEPGVQALPAAPPQAAAVQPTTNEPSVRPTPVAPQQAKPAANAPETTGAKQEREKDVKDRQSKDSLTQERKIEQRKPAAEPRKKIMVADKKKRLDMEDEGSERSTSFAVEREPQRDGFFGFLFGN